MHAPVVLIQMRTDIVFVTLFDLKTFTLTMVQPWVPFTDMD